MRLALFTIVLTGCSWLDDVPDEPQPQPEVVPEVAAPPITERGCQTVAGAGGILHASVEQTGATVVLPAAEDWALDCTRSEDPDGNVQFLSASSLSLNRSAYILSLSGPIDADAETMLDIAVGEMRRVWEMSGSVDVDRPYPSRPVAVLRATDGETSQETWQVVTVGRANDDSWVRIHETWSCNGCGLDGMAVKGVIDGMVSASGDWGFGD